MLFNNFLSQEISNVLDTLTDRQSCIIRLRYGLDDGRMRSLEEIALQLNLSRERVRQIEAKALRRLRHPSRNRVLKEYLRASVIRRRSHTSRSPVVWGERHSLGFSMGAISSRSAIRRALEHINLIDNLIFCLFKPVFLGNIPNYDEN